MSSIAHIRCNLLDEFILLPYENCLDQFPGPSTIHLNISIVLRIDQIMITGHKKRAQLNFICTNHMPLP